MLQITQPGHSAGHAWPGLLRKVWSTEKPSLSTWSSASRPCSPDLVSGPCPRLALQTASGTRTTDREATRCLLLSGALMG